MLVRLPAPLAAALLLPPPGSALAASAPSVLPATLSEELVLDGDHIIEVTINGEPARVEVNAEAFGTPIVNPALARRLKLRSRLAGRWIYGSVEVRGRDGIGKTRFGDHTREMRWSWGDRPVSTKADGVIGVHQLPYARVTFVLAPAREGETLQRLPLKRSGGRVTSRIGTDLTIGGREMLMVFATARTENLVTAPTANFIATHQEGAFEPGSDGTAVLPFAIKSPTRMMRLAFPIELGDLLVERFAVRVEDYGSPDRVGEMDPDDSRFVPGQILVSRRKGRGKPDYLTRIGSDQIAHCSRLTYDLERSEIRLSCAARQD